MKPWGRGLCLDSRWPPRPSTWFSGRGGKGSKVQMPLVELPTAYPQGGGSDSVPISGSGSTRSPAEMEEDATQGRPSQRAADRVGAAA